MKSQQLIMSIYFQPRVILENWECFNGIKLIERLSLIQSVTLEYLLFCQRSFMFAAHQVTILYITICALMHNCNLPPDTMVRQAAMAVKCMLLMYYKNCRGRNYRRQVAIFLKFLCFFIISFFIFSWSCLQIIIFCVG